MKFFCLAVVVISVVAGAASAQRSTPTPNAKSDDVVRISTTLIQIDATVLDKNGKVVKGLTTDDFEIYENGQKQRITNLSFIEPIATAQPAAGAKNNLALAKLKVPWRYKAAAEG